MLSENMSLNNMGPFILRLFPVVNTVVLHSLSLVESAICNCRYGGIAYA